MKKYINGCGIISAQKTFDNSQFLDELTESVSTRLACSEPIFKEYINPVALRRMSRIMRRGVTSAKIAMKEAEIEMPDAIIAGTALGCMEDTETFLTDMINNSESLLTPTAFIQSTHNTINSQIAILLKCTAYNFTHSNRGFSFENALLDSFLQLTQEEVHNILVGGFDEMTDNHFIITNRLGNWRTEGISNFELIENPGAGTIAGEGSAFFVLSDQKSDNSYCRLQDLKMYFEPYGMPEIISNIEQFLAGNLMKANDIDLVIMGYNGDEEGDGIYHYLDEHLFSNNAVAAFKHLSGEYQTASAFALWAGSKILKNQHIPEIMKIRDTDLRTINSILIYNHSNLTHHSAYLLSRC